MMNEGSGKSANDGARTVLLSHTRAALALYYGDEALARLRAVVEVRTVDSDTELSLPELIERAAGCDIVVSFRATTAPRELFAGLPQLLAFVRCAVDIRNVDVVAASEHGVLVTHASAGFVSSVVEWTLGAMIDLSRDLTASTLAWRAGTAPPPRLGRTLRGSTLGLIGFGRIARELAGIALALGMHVVVADPYSRSDDERIVSCDLDALLGRADFVVCLAVASAQTENLMDAAAFARMKPGAFFVNPSRGNLVDDDALLAALDTGRIAGCALDVGRDADQMPSLRLALHPCCIATPHVGGLTRAAIDHQAFETVTQVVTILRGDMPSGAANGDADGLRFRARATSAGG